MPNWCSNQITITGDKSVIDKIEKIVKEEDHKNGLLNYMSPMPKQLEDTTSPSSASDKPQPMVEGFDCWYDWRVEKWGTKWDVNEFYGVDRQGDTISFFNISSDKALIEPKNAHAGISFILNDNFS